MRLIDADKIGLTDFEIVMCEGSYENALGMLIYKISNAPSIDAVEVVRCRDCKFSIDFYKDGDCYCERPEEPLFYKGESWSGFCEKGEREKE